MNNKITDTKQDKLLNAFCVAFAIFLMVICAYPIYLVVISSISDPDLVSSGKVLLIPKKLTLEAYKQALQKTTLLQGYKNTLIYTVCGTTLSMMLTIPCAYALSRPNLAGRKVIMTILIITMYFSGGMIPSFLLMKGLGLLNTWLAIPLSGAVGVTYIIIARTFFSSSIPDSIQDAAMLDGCSELQSFWHIVLPLSKSMISVIMLYYVVGRWNSYVTALYYLPMAREKYPLQMVLRDLIKNAQKYAESENAELADYYARMLNQIKYAFVVLASLPVLALYPFLQKYFEKGIMIGSVKG